MKNVEPKECQGLAVHDLRVAKHPHHAQVQLQARHQLRPNRKPKPKLGVFLLIFQYFKIALQGLEHRLRQPQLQSIYYARPPTKVEWPKSS